jgi:hypothetical protein
VAGLRQHAGTLHRAAWAPILSREDWEALVALRKDNGVRGRPGKYVLTGLVYCGGEERDGTPCEARMQTSHAGAASGRFRTWACGGKQSYHGGCGRVGAHADMVEAVVVAKVLDSFDGSSLAEVMATRATSDESARETLSQLSTLETRLKTLKTEYSVEGIWSKADFLEHKAEIEGRIAALSAKIPSNSTARLPSGITDLRAWWPTASVEERRAVISLVVDRVVVAPATRRGDNRFDETRVQVRWKA